MKDALVKQYEITTNCELRITNYELQITDNGLRMTGILEIQH